MSIQTHDRIVQLAQRHTRDNTAIAPHDLDCLLAQISGIHSHDAVVAARVLYWHTRHILKPR